jgi:acyl transferase domain-containing protein
MKNDIAVVGMSICVPQAANLQAFWSLLKEGRDAITELTAARYGFDQVPPSLKQGGFIDPELPFDPADFGINEREAQHMDPQQKMLLTLTQQAFIDAHLNPLGMTHHKTGVFIGVMGSDWGRISFADPKAIEVYTGTGNGYCMIANRISYCYNLKGPSMAIDTACSSSLVALDLARQALLVGDIDFAIVGGVNLILSPALNLFYQKAGLLSKEGRCKPFGCEANGIVRGEGGAILILQRLEAAEQVKARIYAVIKASAVNHNGQGNGLTAPNRWAQQNVIEQALSKSGLEAADISYVEAHGTGTLLGDPIEAKALGESVGQARSSPLYLGSVKGNIGHLEGAAGIVGVVKTALALHHQIIPPSLHFQGGNALINFKALNLRVPENLLPWQASCRYAGISAFGLGGTNAHVILANAPVPLSHVKSCKRLDQKWLHLISQVSGIAAAQIHAEAHFIEDLGFDSLMLLDFKSEVERQFGLEGQLELSELVKHTRLDGFIDYVERISSEEIAA